MKEEVNRLMGKVEEIRNEVSVRPKNRAEGGKSKNKIKQVRLSNVRGNSEGRGNRLRFTFGKKILL